MKPENILIDSSNNCRLADFGLAKENVKKLHNATSFWGSPAYVAPELLKYRQTGKEGDYYQLGVVLYEMLVGIPPFFSESVDDLYKAKQQGKYDCPFHVSPEAQDLIAKLLTVDPKKRLVGDDINKHSFFSHIDWEQVTSKSINSPLLCFDDNNETNEELNMFKAQSIPVKFIDHDYSSPKETLNRVRGFTFKRRKSHG
jgi:serum/glucocorticoid-regulated kinase 2